MQAGSTRYHSQRSRNRTGTKLYGVGRAASHKGTDLAKFTEVLLPKNITITHVAPGHVHTLLIDCTLNPLIYLLFIFLLIHYLFT